MDFFKNRYFLFAIRLILGAIFIYSSIDKIINPDLFAKAINNYKILPLFMVNFTAIVLPYLEFITGLFLIFGIYTKTSALFIIVMLVIFLIALISAYARGLDISCGCFSLESTSTKSDILMRIIEDLLMLAGAVILYKNTDKSKLITSGDINNEPIH